MAEEFAISQSTIGGGAGISSSPKMMYTFLFFREWCAWADALRRADGDDGKIDNATAVLLAACPDKKTREQFWIYYTEEKKRKGGVITASASAAGLLMSFLAESLEFTESSYGGF